MRVKFGSSGIRGPWGRVATPDVALALGRAVGAARGTIALGRDARTSSSLLADAVAAGALSAGAEVADAGLLPTPALAYAARAFGAGVVVTASHNPAPDNGFKLWNPDGSAFDAADRRRVEEAIAAPPAGGASWERLRTRVPLPHAVEEHVEAALRFSGPLARPLKVVLDCGNGAACVESPTLLRRLGCDVVTLNAQPDGRFPGRPSEPEEKNLAHLASLVESTGADLGVAHDGDADRCMAVADGGRFVTGDELLCLFARSHAKRKIAVPVDASLALDDSVPGVDVVRTKVGDAFVSETLRATGGDWGGEASGAWIFPQVSLCPDGPLAAAALAALVAREGPLSTLVSNLPRYPLTREAVPVAEDAKAAVLEAVASRLADLGKVTTLDGVRVDAPEGWILVRASGTEPKVRLTVETRREADLAPLLDLARRALRAALDAAR